MGDFFEASAALNAIVLFKTIAKDALPAHEGFSDEVRWGLLTHAVVAYSRPFLDNEGDPNQVLSKISRAELGMVLDAKATLEHKKVLLLRSKVIAHADADLRPVHVEHAQCFMSTPTFLYLEQIDFNLFRRIVSHAVTMACARVGAMDKKFGAKLHDDPDSHPGKREPRKIKIV
jgi:hypothetical protein